MLRKKNHNVYISLSMLSTEILKKMPNSDFNNKFDNEIEYVRLTAAAKVLKRDIDDLLHLGATGKLPIIAGVVAKGEYELLDICQCLVLQPGITGPLRKIFGPKDRVELLKEDVAEIEAVGFVIPHSFNSPKEAEKILKEKRTSNLRKKLATFRFTDEISLQPASLKNETQNSLPVTNEADPDWIRRALSPPVKVDKDKLEPDRGLFGIPTFSYLASLLIPWKSVRPLTKDDGVTTKDHLFISKRELDRLQQEFPPSPNERVQIEVGAQKSPTEIKDQKIPLSKEFSKTQVSLTIQTEKENFEKNERNNVLTEVIARAITAAAPSNNIQIIWGKFVEMAKCEERPYPLSGYVDGEVQYEKNGKTGSLSFKNFGARVARKNKIKIKKND